MAELSTDDEGGELPSRRDEILQVAAVVFAERGIKGATVRDIGEAAGILSGSLYYHFDSKEQIVLDLILPVVEAAHERYVAIRQKHRGAAALTELVRDSIMATAGNPHRSMVLRNESRSFSELESLAPVAEVRAKIIQLWLEVIEEGVRDGELRDDLDPDIIVRAIFDGTQGTSRWFLGDGQSDPDHVAEALIAFYIGGLRPL